MILPPSSDGAASVVYTYTVTGLGDATAMSFDGTHIHLADFTDDNVRMILLRHRTVQPVSFIPIP